MKIPERSGVSSCFVGVGVTVPFAEDGRTDFESATHFIMKKNESTSRMIFIMREERNNNKN